MILMVQVIAAETNVYDKESGHKIGLQGQGEGGAFPVHGQVPMC